MGPHSETRRAPVDGLAEERGHLHLLPREPYTAALGETRTVEDDQTLRYGSVPERPIKRLMSPAQRPAAGSAK